MSDDFDKGRKLLDDVLDLINAGQYTVRQVLAAMSSVSWAVAVEAGSSGVEALDRLHTHNLSQFAAGTHPYVASHSPKDVN